jgi:hypothetical protein
MSIPAQDIDCDAVTPTDAPTEDMGAVPDHSASREEKRSILDYVKNRRTESDEKPTRGRPRSRKQKKAASRPKQGAFVEPLMQMYAFAGAALMMKDQHCGTVVLENAERCAVAMDELAYQNESVRRVLDSLTTGSAIGQVLMAHAPIIMAVASHHGGGKIPFIPAMEPEDKAA